MHSSITTDTPTISLCMIVKDEEEVLEGCLKSISHLVNEIVVVDTGSTDSTKKIARGYTDKIYDFEWIDDFSAARNFSFSKATMDYILWLDADDVVLEIDQQKLQALKNSINHTCDVVSMLYNLAFDEYGNPTFSFRRNRMVKRNRNFRWIGPVHEYLEVSGNILKSDIAIIHRKENKKSQSCGRNLTIYENLLAKGTIFTPRDLYYYANELKDHSQYEKAIAYYKEFLTSNKGWVGDVIAACGYVADCYAQLGDRDKELEAILQSFKYDLPRPEECCRLGTHFMNNSNYRAAVFWFNLAINTDPNSNDSGGFHNPAHSTWYPHLQLCVCYWHLGQLEKSRHHNEEASKYRPEDPSVLYNRKFFNDYFKANREI